MLPTGSPVTTGLRAAPPLGGLVITGPRDEPTAIIEATHPDGDPLLARWQAGLGRVAAFTSDAGGAWSSAWSDWDGAGSFWLGLALATARTTTDLGTELTTRFDEDRLLIALEVSGEDAAPGAALVTVEGSVYGPRGVRTAVRLNQTAPGRFEDLDRRAGAGQLHRRTEPAPR